MTDFILFSTRDCTVYVSGQGSVYLYFEDGGDRKHVNGCDEQLGIGVAGNATQRNYITWYNDGENAATTESTYFNNGDKDWGTMKAVPI